ncbi:hypothetical protein [Spirosoma validum]|uniref:Uncharacterized protein n=1 Tax=Spirosoma validum TaxID=2771355 RepID=A0A927B989_9BACT|nr:hypothetical protein [Spirosoma validum]MBD2757694.1 hypothetical protein [Spirosoma validum]
MYNGVSIEVVELWIKEIKAEIGWKPKGKQVFPPESTSASSNTSANP